MMKKASSVTILIILLIETVFRNAIKLAKGLYGLKMFLNSFHKRNSLPKGCMAKNVPKLIS